MMPPAISPLPESGKTTVKGHNVHVPITISFTNRKRMALQALCVHMESLAATEVKPGD